MEMNLNIIKYAYWGKLMRDPHLMYDGRTRIRILEDPNTISYFKLCNIMKNDLTFHTLLSVHYYIPGSKSFNDGLRLIWNDYTTLEILNIWYKNKAIDLYVEHEVDIPMFVEKPILLSRPPTNVFDSENEVCEGVNEGVGFLKKDNKDEGSDVGNEVQTDDVSVDHHGIDDIGEGITRANDAATDDVVVNDAVGDDVAVKDDENVYLVKVRYLSNGEGDEEL